MVSIQLIPPITRCHSRSITLSFFRFFVSLFPHIG
ncbi:hypothetical protein E2C01_096188 [Portunus trituberculatus]|uniref:Uncharacterized protein n=1 Tax=Portunus trituberculatus TaxID=210409 RepID=A0A5B7K1E3_PORTR|nr:hypothetical protein [Portunus trituberculatus]